MVLKIQTNRNGLRGPSQLTREKLAMRITTPAISRLLMFFRMKWLIKTRDIILLCHCPAKSSRIARGGNAKTNRSVGHIEITAGRIEAFKRSLAVFDS
jgi:hypothetical protein